MGLWGRMLGRRTRNRQYDQGILLFDEGEYAQAIEAFKATLAMPATSGLVERLSHFYLAEAYRALAELQIAAPAPSDGGKTNQAIENLQQAISLSPGYADLYAKLGNAYLRQNRPLDALAPLQQALEINPNYAYAMLQMGIALYEAGDMDQGLRSVQRAALLDNNLKDDRFDQAFAADAQGDTATALQHLRLVGVSKQDEATHYAKTGQDLYLRERFDESAAAYRHALEINPHYADWRNQLGVALYAAGDNRLAAEEFARAIAINPRYVEARLNYGLTLQRLQRKSEAIAEFDTVLVLEPDHPAAREYRDELARSAAG